MVSDMFKPDDIQTRSTIYKLQQIEAQAGRSKGFPFSAAAATADVVYYMIRGERTREEDIIYRSIKKDARERVEHVQAAAEAKKKKKKLSIN